MWQTAKRLRAREDGLALTEYLILLGLMTGGVVLSISVFATSLAQAWTGSVQAFILPGLSATAAQASTDSGTEADTGSGSGSAENTASTGNTGNTGSTGNTGNTGNTGGQGSADQEVVASLPDTGADNDTRAGNDDDDDDEARNNGNNGNRRNEECRGRSCRD